jgi:4-hydroxy 2-oxovalerate aldolase
MNKIQILDCTLRDGGYCNEWNFGYDNIKQITEALVDANIDIVECGFLTNKVEYNSDVSKFTTFEQLSEIIPEKRNGKMFVAMMNYGEYNIDDIPECDGSSIDGIRVAFHKKDIIGALDICSKIKDKGYKVFIQAMVSMSYRDDEFLNLINMVNVINPYAFYIVDSFGMMKGKDLIRLFYMVEHNLNKSIKIGFHSHNNMQLAYSNAQSFVNIRTDFDLIVDSSVYGMGRGAGNLNTEIFVQYINENVSGQYDIKPLLSIIDEILNNFYQQNYWGYSLPNYISASYNAHPNYAGYLDDKKTLTVADMNEIFDMMEEDKKYTYDKSYIEDLYLRYMGRGKAHKEHQVELKNTVLGKRVILIAPGKSSLEQKKLIIEEASKDDVIVISVNYEYRFTGVDYIFISNKRRFKALDMDAKTKCIVTSNISADHVYFQTDYKALLCPVDSVRDNAGLMAIKFLMEFGVKEILLAGFDGYSHNASENYAESKMSFITRNAVMDAINKGMELALKDYSQKIKVSFLTEPKYVKI